jgi:threonine dehydratase
VNSPNVLTLITIDEVRSAAARIAPHVHRSPLLKTTSISEAAGVEVRLKCENLQKAGSFKIRGAMNALMLLTPEEKARGVVAFSSGNHAQGVALAARMLKIKAAIVMPEGSVQSKVDATRGYGAEVITAGVTAATRGDVAHRIAAERGAVVIPPFDDERVIAGAGTVGLEIVEDWPEVRTIIVPLGGGGLLAGVALAATSINPQVEVYGVEPAAGNDGEQSFHAGRIISIDPPKTIADGARTTAIGERNFAIIRERVKNIVSVPDQDLLQTLKFVVYRTKLLMEPTGALGIAALLGGKIRPAGPTAVVISGGNVDLSLLAS